MKQNSYLLCQNGQEPATRYVTYYFLINIVIKWLLMTYYYTHRCSTHIREAASCSRWELTHQKDHNWTMCRVIDFETLSPNRMFSWKPPLKAQGSMQKRRWEDFKGQRQWKQCLPEQKGWCSNSDTMAAHNRACTGSSQRVPGLKGRTGQGEPNQEATCSWYLSAKEKTQLSAMESHWI